MSKNNSGKTLQTECSQHTPSEHGSSREHEALVGKILIELSQSGLCRCWENKTGTAYRRGRLIRFGLIGSADILGLTKRGHFFAIECKTGAARQSPQQKKFEEMILKYNGKFTVARTVDDAVRAITEWTKS